MKALKVANADIKKLCANKKGQKDATTAGSEAVAKPSAKKGAKKKKT